MKKIIFVLFILTASIMLSFTAYCDENDSLRIGLEYKYKEAAYVPVSNKSIELGFDGSEAGLYYEQGFIIKAENRAFIKAENEFSDFAQAKIYCENAKFGQYSGYAVLKDMGKYCMYIGPFSSVSEAESYRNAAGLKGSAVLCSDRAVGIYGSDRLLAIADGAYNLQVSGVGDEAVSLGDRSYRGKIEFIKNGSALTAVNVVSTEEYLYATVGSEMPEQWHKEALKAQSVAARSFSIFKKNTHSESGYDLCDGTHCQLYMGIEGESSAVKEAVDETKGILAYYNNQVINAVYSSSNGGYSADSMSVWGFESEYLKAVDDSQEEGGKVWTRTFTFSELASLAGNIGSVTGVSIEKDSVSGRVNKLTIKGASADKVLEMENIRTFFASSNGGSLESRNFNLSMYATAQTTSSQGVSAANATVITDSGTQNISGSIYAATADGVSAVELSGSSVISGDYKNTVIEASAAQQTKAALVQTTEAGADSVTFSGRGWGHGAGMSQYGAKTMAENGFTYDQILKHYYTGIELK